MVTLLLALLLTSNEVGLKEPLELKAYVDSPTPWYPNQAGKLLYLIRYRGKIQLLSETLPLLDPSDHFEKLGDTIIDEKSELDYRVQEISIRVKPKKGGTVLIPASSVSGFLYQMKDGKVVPYQKIESQQPPFKIEITPFPEKDRPPFFNGTVGKFTFDLKAISFENWITFKWTVKGKEVDSLVFPPLNCQPGVAGFFQFDDLPVKITGEGDERIFTFRMKPLIPGIEAVPPLSWSTFDPIAERYETWTSAPFPLAAEPLTPSSKRVYKDTPLPPLYLSVPAAEEVLKKGDIPLALLLLQRAWRDEPFRLSIGKDLHALETRAGLPLSPFPLYSVIMSLLQWFVLPLTLFGLWKRSIPLILIGTLLALFLLTPWSKEHRAIVLKSVIPKDSNTLFLAGESVQIIHQEGDHTVIASSKEIGSVPSSSIIAIK